MSATRERQGLLRRAAVPRLLHLVPAGQGEHGPQGRPRAVHARPADRRLHQQGRRPAELQRTLGDPQVPQANPGYFPASVGPVEGPTGRSIPGFRVGDLQDFDTRRTGDKLGKAGRRPGPQPQAPVGRPSALEEALAAEAIERDGYRPGLATELSVQYGGPQRSWEYAVRNALKHHPAAAPARTEADQRAALALTALRERGDIRGLAASLAREHGGSPDVWSRALNAARRLTDPTT